MKIRKAALKKKQGKSRRQISKAISQAKDIDSSEIEHRAKVFLGRGCRVSRVNNS